MAGVQRTTLNNLNINLSNALIVGIIIAKSKPRILNSKKKNGEFRGITTFTLRDSEIDTINVNVWGSEYFILTFYERFLVGDVVDISSPKICVKTSESDIWNPQVTSPFFLSLSEGVSDVNIHGGDTFSMYLPLLHIPSKPSSGYYGLAEVLKLTGSSMLDSLEAPHSDGKVQDNVYVDLLVVVRSVKPAKTIKTKTGVDMSVRTVEIMDHTTPATITLDMFDNDTIQRAENWRTLESVLFISDAKVSWRSRLVKVQVCSKTVITHQPHTADAEALLLYVRNQANTRGGEAAAWAACCGERPSAASVAQIRDRLSNGAPFCASLHALLTHLDLEDAENSFSDDFEFRIRFVDHTGELNARVSSSILEEALGCPQGALKTMSSDAKATLRWKLLLELCTVKLAVSPPKLIVLGLRRATPADPIPLY